MFVDEREQGQLLRNYSKSPKIKGNHKKQKRLLIFVFSRYAEKRKELATLLFCEHNPRDFNLF